MPFNLYTFVIIPRFCLVCNPPIARIANKNRLTLMAGGFLYCCIMVLYYEKSSIRMMDMTENNRHIII